MKPQRALVLIAALLILVVGTAGAQNKRKKKKKQRQPPPVEQPAPEAAPAAEPDPAPAGEEGEVTFDVDDTSKPLPEVDPKAPPPPPPSDDVEEVKPLKATGQNVAWKDIVTVVRKPFLKSHRLELLPTVGITLNDNIIQHRQLNLQINYFLTDVLAIGVEGHLYQRNLLEPYDLVARQARRLPTVNEYKMGAALDFHYVPVYGKFAILDDYLVTWETAFTLGIGFTQTEVIPRDPRFESFSNNLITPNVGVSMRFFVTKWLTVNIGIRDYIFIDKFEPQNRSTEMFASPEEAKADADPSLVNNVLFQAGVAIWFPFSFDYTTFR